MLPNYFGGKAHLLALNFYTLSILDIPKGYVLGVLGAVGWLAELDHTYVNLEVSKG